MTMSQMDAILDPVVRVKDGKAFANSRDVADFFGKNHRDVTRSIDTLTQQEPNLVGAQFCAGVYLLPETGPQEHRCFDMDRDGFTLLAMGFTGPKALKWKLRYIDAFNKMEAELKARPAALPDLSDPVVLVQLLTEHASKRIEAESRAAKAEAKADAMQEDVAAHERLTKADGSLNITEAAKNLGIRPKDLFQWLSHNGWIYKRPNGGSWLGYQPKCNSGLLEHKTTTVLRADGTEKITEQVRITAKGLSTLAKLIQPMARLVS